LIYIKALSSDPFDHGVAKQPVARAAVYSHGDLGIGLSDR